MNDKELVYEYTAYEDARKLGYIYDDQDDFDGLTDEQILKSIGLKPDNNEWDDEWDGAWFDEDEKISCLVIIDSNKWFLAKIKYGI